MNGTKKFLFSLATLAAMPGFADTNGPIISSGESRLEALFKADLQYRSESESDAVVGTEGREGCLYRKWRWNGGWRPTSRNHLLVAVVRELPLSRGAERAISARGCSPLHNQSFRVYRDTGWSPNSVSWQRIWPSQSGKIPNEPNPGIRNRGCPL
jgi:hypothetical protein